MMRNTNENVKTNFPLDIDELTGSIKAFKEGVYLVQINCIFLAADWASFSNHTECEYHTSFFLIDFPELLHWKQSTSHHGCAEQTVCLLQQQH